MYFNPELFLCQKRLSYLQIPWLRSGRDVAFDSCKTLQSTYQACNALHITHVSACQRENRREDDSITAAASLPDGLPPTIAVQLGAMSSSTRAALAWLVVLVISLTSCDAAVKPWACTSVCSSNALQPQPADCQQDCPDDVCNPQLADIRGELLVLALGSHGKTGELQ